MYVQFNFSQIWSQYKLITIANLIISFISAPLYCTSLNFVQHLVALYDTVWYVLAIPDLAVLTLIAGLIGPATTVNAKILQLYTVSGHSSLNVTTVAPVVF